MSKLNSRSVSIPRQTSFQGAENIVPFPSALNKREVRRAAAAIVAGRSRGVDGWLDKQARWLIAARVPRDLAEQDIQKLDEAIRQEIGLLLEGGQHVQS